MRSFVIQVRLAADEERWSRIGTKIQAKASTLEELCMTLRSELVDLGHVAADSPRLSAVGVWNEEHAR